MPKRQDLWEALRDKHGYSLKVEGTPAVLRQKIVTHDDLVVGDQVELFTLPDGKFFVSKVATGQDGLTIGKITAAHVYFDDDITVKEI